MLIRASIVLLIALNLGVAAWWLLRDAPPPRAPEPLPAGVVPLQLVGEPAAEGTASAAPPREAPPAAARQCFSLGPFENTLAATRAREGLDPDVQVRLRREPVDSGQGWRVLIPPRDTIDDAQALARRIGEAGIEDFLVMREGADARAIALGRYGSEATARRRVEAMAAAGFEGAVAQPLGDAAQVWLDITAAGEFDADAARTATGAAQRETRDCPSGA